MFRFLFVITILFPLSLSAKEYQFSCRDGSKTIGNLFINTNAKQAQWASYPIGDYILYDQRYISWAVIASVLRGAVALTFDTQSNVLALAVTSGSDYGASTYANELQCYMTMN